MNCQISKKNPLASYYESLAGDMESWGRKVKRGNYTKREIRQALSLLEYLFGEEAHQKIFPLRIIRQTLELMEDYGLDFIEKKALDPEIRNALFAFLNF